MVSMVFSAGGVSQSISCHITMADQGTERFFQTATELPGLPAKRLPAAADDLTMVAESQLIFDHPQRLYQSIECRIEGAQGAMVRGGGIVVVHADRLSAPRLAGK